MEPNSSLDFVVDDLPGIGRSYQMTGTNGGRITVVVHHSGRRVVASQERCKRLGAQAPG
jgi:K+/H+ antiporter YhaU regulatory subunit KhtT